MDVEPRELHPQVLKGSDLKLTHTLAAEFQDGANHFKLHAIPRGHVKRARHLQLVQAWRSILIEGLLLAETDLTFPVNVKEQVVTTGDERARSILQVGAVGTGQGQTPNVGGRFVSVYQRLYFRL